MAVYHILNGDAFAEIFPAEIKGERIIWRECLVDGPLPDADFFTIREAYIRSSYAIEDTKYSEKVTSEFRKIQEIEEGSAVYFWFEDDLFCQVNFWFLISSVQDKNIRCFRIFPNSGEIYFSHDKEQLIQNFKNSLLISNAERDELAQLWLKFRLKLNIENSSLKSVRNFPALKTAVKKLFSGEILDDIRCLAEEHQDFNILFTEFKKRYPIYGFGDLQLQSLLKKANEKPTD